MYFVDRFRGRKKNYTGCYMPSDAPRDSGGDEENLRTSRGASKSNARLRREREQEKMEKVTFDVNQNSKVKLFADNMLHNEKFNKSATNENS